MKWIYIWWTRAHILTTGKKPAVQCGRLWPPLHYQRENILDKSRASPVDCCCNQCKHWLLPLFLPRLPQGAKMQTNLQRVTRKKALIAVQSEPFSVIFACGELYRLRRWYLLRKWYRASPGFGGEYNITEARRLQYHFHTVKISLRHGRNITHKPSLCA